MPQNRKDGNSSYVFEMPKELHEQGRTKSKENNFPLAELFRIHYENFVNNPIEHSMAIIRNYNLKNKPKRAIDRRK